MCINLQTVRSSEGEEYKVPCGKCILCRMKRAQNWAIKLIKESYYHKKMCMVTLTFDPKKLIDHECGSNVMYSKNLEYSKEHFQKFMKRLRKKFPSGKISYFKIGEYGEKHKRAHYHVIFYGLGIEDLECKLAGMSNKSKEIYTSKIIDEAWKLGICTVSECNNAVIKYVANYSLKKIKNTKENDWRKPKMSFSNRNKIGIKWCRRNHREMRKGYLEDSEHQRYGIPRSWKKELEKHSMFKPNKEHIKTLLEIENKIVEYIENATKTGALTKENLLKKAKILEYRVENKNKERLDL